MSYSRNIPAIVAAGLMAAVGCLGVCSAQAPASAPSSVVAKPKTVISKAELVSLINEISLQQQQIATNMEAIDKKTAELDELLRQARIYVSRGGGGGSR